MRGKKALRDVSRSDSESINLVLAAERSNSEFYGFDEVEVWKKEICLLGWVVRVFSALFGILQDNSLKLAYLPPERW